MDSVLDELLATSENGKHVYVGEKFSVGVRFFFLTFFFVLSRSRAPTTKFYTEKLTLFFLSREKKTGRVQQAHGAPDVLHRRQPGPGRHARGNRRPEKGDFVLKEKNDRKMKEKKTHSRSNRFPLFFQNTAKSGGEVSRRGQGHHRDVL